uniref:Uncharacterized protein n=1 Tax=Strombidium inclinatum TaxID=197538 RepID=A0A7S3IEU7_9SPIT|mmetsp:Transcript_13096/g.20334  ORF Transcript_13096/g.20334 Transcript_13096/m.20334 type:complete len:291 (+) Transcript_13096:455-1327(+)
MSHELAVSDEDGMRVFSSNLGHVVEQVVHFGQVTSLVGFGLNHSLVSRVESQDSEAVWMNQGTALSVEDGLLLHKMRSASSEDHVDGLFLGLLLFWLVMGCVLLRFFVLVSATCQLEEGRILYELLLCLLEEGDSRNVLRADTVLDEGGMGRLVIGSQAHEVGVGQVVGLELNLVNPVPSHLKYFVLQGYDVVMGALKIAVETSWREGTLHEGSLGREVHLRSSQGSRILIFFIHELSAERSQAVRRLSPDLVQATQELRRPGVNRRVNRGQAHLSLLCLRSLLFRRAAL